MAIISIKYNENEFEPNLGYKSVSISHKEGKSIFDSGNFVKDWFECIRFAIKELPEDEFVSHSFLVDHFIMDGAKFDSAHLVVKKGKAYLDYETIEGVEIFVEEGTKPSWEDLKKLLEDGEEE